MKSFNKYSYVRNLIENIKTDVDVEDKFEDEVYEDVVDYIRQDIDNACIYYADCFAIIAELNFTSFAAEDNDMGIEITNVSQAAFVALEEYVMEEIDVYELTNEITE